MRFRFKRFTFSWLSPLIGFHYGRNPVSGQRFLHIAPIPFFGIDFEFQPYMDQFVRREGPWLSAEPGADDPFGREPHRVGIDAEPLV